MVVLKILCICLILFFTGCDVKNDMTGQEIEITHEADEIIENVVMTTMMGSKIEWEMKAQLSKRYTADKFMIAYYVTLETLNTMDKNFYSSDSVYVYEVQDEFIGMGNVIITNPKATLKTDKIIWNRLSDKVHAPNDVYLKRDNHEMWGSNLFTNSRLDYIDMQGVSGHGVVERIIDN